MKKIRNERTNLYYNWEYEINKVMDDLVASIPEETKESTRQESRENLEIEVIIFNLLTNPQKYEYSYEGFKKTFDYLMDLKTQI